MVIGTNFNLLRTKRFQMFWKAFSFWTKAFVLILLYILQKCNQGCHTTQLKYFLTYKIPSKLHLSFAKLWSFIWKLSEFAILKLVIKESICVTLLIESSFKLHSLYFSTTYVSRWQQITIAVSKLDLHNLNLTMFTVDLGFKILGYLFK